MDTQAIQFGMMASLRTNNIIVDTLVCMLIPALFTALANSSTHFGTFVGVLRQYVGRRDSPSVVRKIETKQAFNTWGKVHDSDEHNHILQKAISIYLSQHLDLKDQSGRYELLESAAPDSSTDQDDDHSSEDSYNDWNAPDEKDQLKKLQVGALPPLNAWIQVEDQLCFKHEVVSDERNPGKGQLPKQSTVTFYLSSTASNASERIDAFVERAYANYQELVLAKHKQDKARYLYIADSASNNNVIPLYKRYALGEDKTFHSLFFEEKESLLHLLDNFATKSGKFGIPGFPYKMGLLLHGPPGTGKTSLIKAIAQHTKRHIVNISLSKIKTNQELMDMMFDLKFGIQGEDLPIKLAFDNIVFVMEDVDCASNVVHARTSVTNDMSGAATTTTTDIESLDDAALSKALSDIIKSSGTNASKCESKDKLNLSGLLNVLDGVVDSPGRILIMTTNHPEKLDPALVRPGRVNKKLFLGHMTARQAQLMMEHYFKTALDPKQRLTVDEAFGSRSVSPAQVEQLCAEYDDVGDALAALTNL
ncbi:hypothetical protein DYB32_009894 [Aphanomyces invadans]|uniref:AAA+ ATPase domain-containing protein n=1 Tax=Aphanomyces invadans TaxID=157072 RepID=A0A418AH91_9STRA|nr:hypothetical protein DYB32_009894 [Aphanomyces invadans]